TKGINGVNYVVSKKGAESLRESCKDVINPSTNMPALNILCARPADQCTAKDWLHYMGSTSNGQAPFNIFFTLAENNVTIGNTTLHPLDTKPSKCSEAPFPNSTACSCQDCEAVCPPRPPPIVPPGRCHVLHMDCYDFAFSIVFATFLLVFGIALLCYNIVFQDSLRLEEPGEEHKAGNLFSWKGPAAARNQRKHQRLNSITSGELSLRERLGARIENFLEHSFRRWGCICAYHPFIVMIVVLVIAGGLCAGIAKLTVTTDPVKLWSSPDSQARLEKEYFDSHFGPFYRTEQIIISRPENHTTINYANRKFSNIFDKTFMEEILALQNAIADIEADYGDSVVTLSDICFAPLAPDNTNCTIQSVFNYFQNSKEMLDKNATKWGWLSANYLDHFLFCVQSPFSLNDTTDLHTPCLGTYGGPVFPWVALGGYEGKEYHTAKAFVITFLVNNNIDERKNGPAKAWEKAYIDFMKDYISRSSNVSIAFNSERSIQDEIERESEGDIVTILASYLIMFAYITITLGQYKSFDRVLIDAKITLGLAGVILVPVSVGASLGFYSFLGIPSTLIIVEVVPFLVLAVGVDNIFILVQTYQREMVKEGETLEDLIGRVVGHVGPSMLLTSLSESLAFFLGALTSMPAVRVFSLYAAMAVLFNFLLQITVFVSLLTLDAKRQEMVVFVGWWCVSAALTSRVNIGLNQALSVPTDSYVLKYFNNLNEYLSVGAPVYFVVEDGYDYSTYNSQNKICGVAGCDVDSLVEQAHTAALTNNSYIAEPVSSWLDDFFVWSTSPKCCRSYNNTGEFCPSIEKDPSCVPCRLHDIQKGRPVGDSFNKYAPWFLKDNPNINCAKGGHAAYGPGVELVNTTQKGERVGATYFMTYHTILKDSHDFIEALKSARRISDDMTHSLSSTGQSKKVFPYSVFYVFYEQYLTIVENAFLNIAYCLAAILFITFVLLGFDLYSAVIVVLTIIMIIVDITGMMYLWGIQMNALSLVNLIMAIGISVEFCSHIIRAFTICVLPTRKERAKFALDFMGSSVLSGITLTKLGGIIMLGFSQSQLFEVFYFRMYLGIVVFGATHGLIFLPVLLSYVGPPVNKAKVFQDNIDNQKNSMKDVSTSSSYGASQEVSYNGD
ncbi:niemann-Pick C1 protein, partial [Elysia marginata]